MNSVTDNSFIKFMKKGDKRIFIGEELRCLHGKLGNLSNKIDLTLRTSYSLFKIRKLTDEECEMEFVGDFREFIPNTVGSPPNDGRVYHPTWETLFNGELIEGPHWEANVYYPG